MIDYVEVYNENVTNGMTKEEFNMAVDLCVKYPKNELRPEIARRLSFDSEVMKLANIHLTKTNKQ